MNDPGLLKELLDKLNQQASLMYTVGGFIAVNIIVGVINFFGQRSLKKLDTSVHRRNIREDKKLGIFHDLYKRLDNLRLIYNDPNLLQNELRDITTYINENALYLNEDELQITEDYCNYFTRLIVSIRHKDVATEKMYMDKLKKEFNK